MKTQNYGDGNGEEAAIRTQEMRTRTGRGTPIRIKSTVLSDPQGKVSRPIFNFVHFVDDVVLKARDFSAFKSEDEQSDIELKPTIEKLKT